VIVGTAMTVDVEGADLVVSTVLLMATALLAQ